MGRHSSNNMVVFDWSTASLGHFLPRSAFCNLEEIRRQFTFEKAMKKDQEDRQDGKCFTKHLYEAKCKITTNGWTLTM